jgi:hypothetical protein
MLPLDVFWTWKTPPEAPLSVPAPLLVAVPAIPIAPPVVIPAPPLVTQISLHSGWHPKQ